MAKHGNSKYRPKYARELLNGLRSDGKSIDECCANWGVTITAYNGWRKTHPKFEIAHQQGELDKTSWWRKLQRQVATGEVNGNPGVINLALKNEAGYVDKQEIHNSYDEKIETIKIELLPNRQEQQGRVLEHVQTVKHLVDEKPS